MLPLRLCTNRGGYTLNTFKKQWAINLRKIKNNFFVGIFKVTDEKSRDRIRTKMSSPDPYQNFTDPEHGWKGTCSGRAVYVCFVCQVLHGAEEGDEEIPPWLWSELYGAGARARSWERARLSRRGRPARPLGQVGREYIRQIKQYQSPVVIIIVTEM